MTFEETKRLFSDEGDEDEEEDDDENKEIEKGKYADEYLKDHISDLQSLSEAFAIFSKYAEPTELSIHAEHDVLYVAEFYEDMTEEELVKLRRLGFHLDSDSGGWAKFC